MYLFFPGYNQQMMPPPMGPNQMGYSPGNKMPGMGGGQYAHFNSQYSQQPGIYNYWPFYEEKMSLGRKYHNHTLQTK